MAVGANNSEVRDLRFARLIHVPELMQGLEQDPQTWTSLAEAEIAVTRQLARLKPVSDESAPTVKELQRKRDALDRALDFLQRYSPKLQRSEPSAADA